MNLERLKDKFKPDEIEFRVGSTNEKRENGKVIQRATKGLVLPYVTNRAIQNRLDDVCGAENWCNVFQLWQNESQLCGISIRMNQEENIWVTKWDGAENTKTEPIKGGLSNAMKRAAVQWGIGRYLYQATPEWVDVIPRGKSYIFREPPKLPKELLPDGANNAGYVADVATPEDVAVAELVNSGGIYIDEGMLSRLNGYIDRYRIDITKLLHWAGVQELNQLTVAKYNDYIDILRHSMPGFEEKEGKTIDITDSEKRQLERLNKAVGLK